MDCVRALAIVMVLLTHCGAIGGSWFGVSMPVLLLQLGYLGVELFFVLSGFLIGFLLLEILQEQAGMRDWLIFMLRRWMRTLPLYYAWLAVLAVFWAPRYWLVGHQALWRDLPWFATLTQNLAWPMVDNWFSVSWSLAVEEWFYLLFSGLLLLAAAAIGQRGALAAVLALFIVVPTLLRLHMPHDADWNEVTSKMVFCRLDAIAYGIGMAWLYTHSAWLLRWRWALFGLGVCVVGWVWSGVTYRLITTPEHVRGALIFSFASIGFALWLPAAAAVQWSGWWTHPVRLLSAQSYGTYIMHMSVLEVVSSYRGRLHLAPLASALLATAAIAGLPYLSFRFFERPILVWRPRQFASAARDRAPLVRSAARALDRRGLDQAA